MTCGNSGFTSCSRTLYTRNSQILLLKALVALVGDPQVAVPINDALLTCTLVDGQGNDVTGLINLPLSSIGSPAVGDYSGQIDGAVFNPAPGQDYLLRVSGTDVFGVLYLELPVVVLERTS